MEFAVMLFLGFILLGKLSFIVYCRFVIVMAFINMVRSRFDRMAVNINIAIIEFLIAQKGGICRV